MQKDASKMKFIQAIQPYRFSLHLVFVPLLIMAFEYGGLFILGVPIFGYLLIPSIDFLLRQYKVNDFMTKDEGKFLTKVNSTLAINPTHSFGLLCLQRF